MDNQIFKGKKQYMILQIILSIFFLLGGLGCVILMFMMPEGVLLMMVAAAVSVGIGYWIAKRIICCITISDGMLFQEGVYSGFDITIQHDEVDYWIEEHNERVEYGIIDNTVMLVKGSTIIHKINTRMIHNAKAFKESLPWPYKGIYEKDMTESMWMGNTIKKSNIKTVEKNAE